MILFLENLKTIAIQVFCLYIIAGIGFITDKKGLFNRNDAKKVIDLLFNIVLPIAVISSFSKIEYTAEHVRGLLIAVVCSVATHLFAMALSALTFRKRKSNLEKGLYHYAAVFSNTAFLGLPLAQSVIGDEGVFYCSVYIGVFNIFAFTYGIYEISGKKAKLDIKQILINPGTVSVIIGVPLFLLQVDLPYFISYPMELVSQINSPLAMIVFGTFLANSNFKNIFIKKEIYFISALRLIVIPLIMMFLFRLFSVDGNLLVTMTICASAPSATNTAMFAAKYDNDAGLGSELCAQSSILSVITMPVLVALATVL